MPVVLLCHCDGTNGSTTFTDVSPSARTLTSVTGAAVSTAQVKFGTGSALFTGSTAIAIGPPFSDFDFQSGPFTLEAWAYVASTPGVAAIIAQFQNTAGFGWFFGSVGGLLAFWYYDGAGGEHQFSSATAIPTGGWHFYTADRDVGGTLRLYLDGVVVASTSAPTFQSVNVQTNIGNSLRTTDYWPGYIDEVRITKGTALYGGAFTPPTQPFSTTNAQLTQIAAEHWAIATPPPMRATQVAMEHWVTTNVTNPQMALTQIAIEQWASVAVISASSQVRAWIMA